MSSKRMAISALLSNDASTSSQPPSPAVARSSDEPPPKRQRHQDYNQQYYDSYNAYPYSSSTSSSPTSRYYPAPQASHQPRKGSPNTVVSQAWPQHPSPSRPQSEHRAHWEDIYRHTSPSSVPVPNAFDFPRQHRQTSNLRGADDEGVDGVRDGRSQPLGTGKGQSIASVLNDRMRAPQTHTALPAPPQLRRDAQFSHHSYPTLRDDSSLPPVYNRDAPPLSVKIATPRPTPPNLSPRSSYSLQNNIPTASYSTQSISPTSYTPHSVSPTIYSRQNISHITHPPSPQNSPTNPYPPSRSSIHHEYTPSISPITSQPPHFSRASSSMSFRPASASGSPTASYTPPPFKPPSRPPSSRPPSSRDYVPSPVSERERSPYAAPPLVPPRVQPPPPPVQFAEAQQPPQLKPAPMEVDDERSFEDELLSLVDGEDVKPKVARPPLQPPRPEPSQPPEVQENRKPSSPTKSPVKPKQATKPRAPAKSKAKSTAKQTSATGTPVPASSMPPPSPPPTKQQPAVSRAKGKTTSTRKKPTSGSAVRSRSLSVKPADPTPTPVPDIEIEREDDRLYCICRTPYDEDRIMIACDRCDEWYHPACVGMPEVEVDLVDQYICARCAKQKAGLQTTYKPRCHRGVKHIASHDTLPACWKPARGAFSKYCSDECGMAHMRAKISQSGRDAASLWPAVKNARRREGVTVTNGPVKMEEPDDDKDKDLQRRKANLLEARKALKEADERELSELRRRLEEVMSAREACKASLERVVMRRRLLDLAVDRATGRCCGWDARLEMNDDVWTAWATTDEGRRALDGGEAEGDEQWWCQGPEKCPRHSGWQNIRDLDVQVEVDSKNSNIKQLTDRERELRRRIEDINPPSAPAKQHGRPGGRKKSQGKKSAR